MWLLFLLLGVALRLQGFATRPLWLDEALQVQISSAPDVWQAIRAEDMHPPLLTLLVRPLLQWMPPWWVARLPSLLAGIALIPAMWWTAHRWLSPRAAQFATALAAFHVLLAGYAGEARPYALGILWLALHLGALAPGPARRRPWALLWGSAAVWTLVGAWPVVLLGPILLLRGRRRLFHLGVLGLQIAACFLLFTKAQLLDHQGAGMADGHMATLFPFQDGFAFAGRQIPSAFAYLVTGLRGRLAWLVGVPLLLVGLLAAWRHRDAPLTRWTWTGLLAFLLLSLLGLHPFGPTRHLLVLTPLLLLWSAEVAGSLRFGRQLQAIAVLLAWTMGMPRPTEDVPGLLAQLPDVRIPVVADPSVAPAMALYATDQRVVALPWLAGPPLTDAAGVVMPPGQAFWWVAADYRQAASQDLLQSLQDAGWTMAEEVMAAGVGAALYLPPEPGLLDPPIPEADHPPEGSTDPGVLPVDP